MSNKTVWESFLKDACGLTGAAWSAIVACHNENWVVDSSYQISESLNHELLQLMGGSDFQIRLKSKKPNLSPFQVPLALKHSLNCIFIYFFELPGPHLILVGTVKRFSSNSRGIWGLAAYIDGTLIPQTSDSEVGLLQHDVLELQQTQQELQARISAQREAEARLIQAAKLAAVGEMAAGVAHELNNPLTSVVGFTELALDELPVDAGVRGDLELVLKEARRARSVVRRLLDFARQAETTRVKADINEIVDDMLVLTKHLMQTNNVLPVVNMGINLPWVSVDRNQIKQVVINLVNNALYAMPGGGRLEVTTQEQTRFGRPWLSLSIRDNGIGISPENLERIFEPFFTTRGDRGGTGLGLSVTYGIVTDHGGMIEVESQLRVGSTFTVWLPLDQNP